MKIQSQFAALVCLWAGLAVAPLQAQTAAPTAAPTAQLKPPADRISDAAINADLMTYEALQARLKALNDGGRPVRDYHLSKAQCWLDVSLHEYTRNDRGPFPQEALNQADRLAQGMEIGQPPLTMDTPLVVAGAQRLRPDLWALAEALKGQRGWRCAQQKTACAEVELVHAGNEHAQQGWRHAKPYVQIAEDLVAEAQVLAERCDPPAPPPVVAAPAPAPVVVAAGSTAAPAQAPVPAQPPRRLELTAVVVFDFDRADEAGLRLESRRELAALVARIQTENLGLRQLQLVGHADRLNSTGVAAYNQRLSERRAATVLAVLAKLGLATRGATVQAVGNAQQVLPCSGDFASKALLQACLLPNRRVELRVIVEAGPAR